MLDLNDLLHFSHVHCVAICSVLVPMNLLATLQTLILVGLNRPPAAIWKSIAIALLAAIVMLLHVLSWFVVGVVMIQTFVLFGLGAVCLGVNLWAASHPQSLRALLERVFSWGRRSLQLVIQGVGA
jgi:hypothetical protein